MSISLSHIPDYERLCGLTRKVPELDPDAVVVFAAVHAVGLDLAASVDAGLAEHGISEGRLRVLAKLMFADEPMTHSELAECSNVTKGTITGLIDGLEREGLVRREPSDTDRRVIRVDLTDAGVARVRQLLPSHLTRLSRMMAKLSRAEQKTLVALLRKVQAGVAAVREADGAAQAAQGASE